MVQNSRLISLSNKPLKYIFEFRSISIRNRIDKVTIDYSFELVFLVVSRDRQRLEVSEAAVQSLVQKKRFTNNHDERL